MDEETQWKPPRSFGTLSKLDVRLSSSRKSSMGGIGELVLPDLAPEDVPKRRTTPDIAQEAGPSTSAFLEARDQVHPPLEVELYSRRAPHDIVSKKVTVSPSIICLDVYI